MARSRWVLRRDLAISITAQMLQGSARMVLQTGSHPAVLKDQVTPRGGCTIAGLSKMKKAGVRHALASGSRKRRAPQASWDKARSPQGRREYNWFFL